MVTGNNVRKQKTCNSCYRLGHTLASSLKGKFYSKLGPLKANPRPTPSMTMELGDLVVVWHLETTGLSVYHQEPMEIGYAILRVTSNDKKSLKFQRIGSTVSQLTLTDVDPSPEAVGIHHITPEKLHAGGVSLKAALQTLEEKLNAAKSGRQPRVFFLGANSDAFDMRIMQYTLARHTSLGDTKRNTAWFDLLSKFGVNGTIDTTRLLLSLDIINELKGSKG